MGGWITGNVARGADQIFEYDDDRRQQDLAHEREWIEDSNRRQTKMGLKAPSGGTFKALEAGVYAGVCVSVIDVGIQAGGKFKDANKVVIGFELPDAPARDDGQPTVIYVNRTLSMNKKGNLRKDIEGMFGKAFPSDEAASDFDLDKLLGRPALVNVNNVERNGKVYANIAGLTPLMAGMAAPKAKSEPLFYTEKIPETTGSIDRVPSWIRKLIDNQLRPGEPVSGGVAVGGQALADDDIPF